MAKLRTAKAHWSGNLKDGAGTLSSDSGVLNDTPYGFASRFGEAPGVNPEELIAAAHAGCFAMAFSAGLEKAGFTADAIDVSATVELDTVDGKPTITQSTLTLKCSVPNAEDETIRSIADETKLQCPVSRGLNLRVALEFS